MAVLGPLNVGGGPSFILTPDHAPVAGRAGPADWSFGGGGNYIRPFTSYSQRLVEATNSLGPFAMRLGGNITGRLRISTESESLGQLAYQDQDWWNQDDGNTGFESKAEWWNMVVKTVITARDMNSEGHPVIHVEVAIFDPTDPAERYDPPNLWDNIIGLGGVMFGVVPPVFGWIAGGLGGLNPGDPGFGGSGGAANAGNSGTNLPSGGFPGGSPDSGGFLQGAINAVAGMLGDAATLASEYATAIGDSLSSAGEFANNVLMGIEAGELGVHNHVQHNITPPDANGSFDHIPGETKSNPRDLNMRDGLQQGYAKNLGNGVNLFQGGDPTDPANYYQAGSDPVADGQKLSDILVRDGIHLGGNQNMGIGNNGAATISFYIHGRTLFNEGFANNNSMDPTHAAPNPDIDSNGNLRVYDTYEFAESNRNEFGDWVKTWNPDAGTEINAVVDTAPGGIYMYDMLNGAGSIRESNSGGTPGNSNVSALQNTYTAVFISPQNLSQSNPDLYDSLKMSGFYDHVDPSLLP